MTTASASRKAKQELEQVVGEPVRAVDVNWARYLRQGVIVELSIGRWRAMTGLDLADLGLQVEDEAAAQAVRDYIKPGTRRLLPRKYENAAQSIESVARWTLRPPLAHGRLGGSFYAYRTHWGAWVPAESFVAWKQVFQTYQARYMAVRDDIIEHYDEITADVTKKYISIAFDAFTRLEEYNTRRHTMSSGLQQESTRQDRWAVVEEQTRAWVARMIPTKQYIADSFVFSYSVSYVPMPSELARDAERAELILADTAKLKAMQVMQAQVAIEERKLKERILGEFETVVRGQYYGLINELLYSLLDAVQKAQPLPEVGKRIAGKIAALKRQVREMDVFEDTDFAAKLAELDAQASPAATPEQVAVAAQQLQVYVRTQLELLHLDTARLARIEPERVVPDITPRARRRVLTLGGDLVRGMEGTPARGRREPEPEPVQEQVVVS